ncbi:MAG: SCO family protein, partial [Planctomycetota bacterium]
MCSLACRRAWVWTAVFCAAATAAHAQINRGLPEELQGVGVDEKLDAQLPLDLWFTDSDGKRVQLREFFGRRRPVMLTFNYFRC